MGNTMSEEQPPGAEEEELFGLDYARPRLCRRYQKGGVWKSVVRVAAAGMVAPLVAAYVASMFVVPSDAWIAMVCLAGVVAVAAMIKWERGMVLREPIWEGAKDLRASTWRASASRFDSSGVTIVDQHGTGKGGE
jgi:hypothetical protein